MNRSPEGQKKKRTNVIVAMIVFVIIALSLIGVLGGLGNAIKNVLVGALGSFSYALLAIVAFLNLYFGLRLFRKKGVGRMTVYAIALIVILFAYLQIITTNEMYSALEDTSLTGYISACYAAGADTSGGALFGVLAYPLLSLMGKYSAILLAVLFFVVLFFALLPLMRVSKGQASSAKPPKPSKKSKQQQRETPLRLFVDNVEPGTKDGAVIRMRKRSSSDEETYRLFDVFDTTPVTRVDGSVPSARPDRYDAYQGDRAGVRDYEDEYDPEFTAPYDDRRASTPPADEPILGTEDGNELPRFMRHATERAHATRKLYGEDNLRNVIPDEPTYDKDKQAPKKPQMNPTPLVDYSKKKPTPSSFDMIESLDDLKRVTEREAAIRPNPFFLGEISPQEKKATPPVEERQATVTPAPQYEPTPAEEYEDVPVDETDETYDEEDGISMEEDVVAEEETSFRPTITPRDASPMRPIESRPTYSAPASAEPQRSVTSTPEEIEDDDIPTPEFRQRKPRSDIGGTHRTESKPSIPSGYIPPKQTQQVEIEQAIIEQDEVPSRPYVAPPVDFLTEYPPMQDEEGIDELGETLVQALASFNIHSMILDHRTGPTFTQFAVTLPDNMSVNKLIPIDKDIKRKLMIEKIIRIVSSVPGLDAIGIEVPKKSTSMIGLRSLINSPNFEKENKLYFAIGVDVSGRMIYGDLLKMPHLLVAGATGSGKSVCLNVLICSMLYHYSPDVVRFIMVDPKMVELSVYQGIPHMVMPNTIIDVGKAINALTWAVNEMDRRYALLRENHVRSIIEYNELMKKTGGKKMYYIVVIVDEMADLMSRAKRDVEDKIQSITSKARSAGIHLVIATQRPSVDVITGTIKNNIPTRIAFKVTSVNDSRTILDGGGAESLFGNGDMLYCPPDGSEPTRLQGPFLSNEETLNIVEYIKEHNDCNFDAEAEKFIFSDRSAEQDASALPTNTESGDEDDELFADALLFVIQSGQASISKLQRKFRIGYSRAARIIDIMEDRGFIGPTDASNKPRAVLITEQEYYELFGDDGIQGADGQ